MRERLVAGAALLVLLLAVAAGARVGSDQDGLPTASEDPDLLGQARSLLADLWSAADARAFLHHVDERTLPNEPARVLQLFEQLNHMFEQIPFEVVEAELIEIRGEEVARLRIGQVNWCVTSGERILLGCRVAIATVTGYTDLPDVELETIDLDILVHRVDIAAVLTTATDERLMLEGRPELATDFRSRARLQDLDLVIGGLRARAPPGDVLLRPGFGLLFLFELAEPADLESVAAASFRYVWPEGDVTIEVDGIDWLVGPETPWPDQPQEG